MKYIKTINSVYKTLRSSYSNKSYITTQGFVIHKDKVIQTSDKIEKLFDEVVCEGYLNKPCLVELRRDETGIDCLVKGTDDDWFVPESTVETLYGAIWTPKGLIYVAKMNDKGEWRYYETQTTNR